MPAVIIFASSSNGAGSRPQQLQVDADAAEVARKLASAGSDFAEFSPKNKPQSKVWVNRDQVRMVRST